MSSQSNGRITLPVPVLVGTSPVAKEIEHFVHLAAACSEPILLRGETGTGKDHLAELIHHLSRSEARFMVVDCGALSESISESELFGHIRGAFTGAAIDKPGVIALAGQGTLFFNEVANMNLALQAKFLRILEGKPYRPLGGRMDLPVNARIITATNADLEMEMKALRFRKDLFYRLDVISFTIPPLRDHKEDIPALVAHFWGANNSVPFPQDVLEQMLEHDWPGNIRELKHAVIRQRFRTAPEASQMVHLSHTVNNSPSKASLLPSNQDIDGTLTVLEELPGTFDSPSKASLLPSNQDIDGTLTVLEELPGTFDEKMDAVHRGLLARALMRTKGNKRQAARLLGMSRTTFIDRMQRLGLGNGQATYA